MNKLTVRISSVVMWCAMLFNPYMGWSAAADDSRTTLSDNEIRWKIDQLMGPIDYRYNANVRRAVENYLFDYPQGSEELLGRVAIYFPLFEEKLAEKGLPQQIKYLSIIESSLKVDAYSRMGAAGLWQFMRGTAREYGLTVSKSIDMRYDVEESTEAALNYLAFLYEQFDDWTLALAAYNCGPGNVRKAIRRAGQSDYWAIQKYLPTETRNYIPKFVAASYLLEYFHEYDLRPVRPEDYHFQTVQALVYQHLSFDQIARITETPMAIIQNLNPSIRKNFIPANTNGFKLTLPRMAMYRLIHSDQLLDMVLIPEKKIDYNGYIRSKFAPEVAQYLLLDLQENQRINRVPVLNMDHFSYAANLNDLPFEMGHVPVPQAVRREDDASGEYIQYRLRPGESLTEVADRFPQTDILTLIRINEISLDNPPAPGTLLKITEN